MKKAYLVIGGVGFVGILIWIVILIVGPRSVRLINLSGFSSPQEMGELTFARMLPQLESTQLMAIGTMPQQEYQSEVVDAFIRTWEKMSPSKISIFIEDKFPLATLLQGHQGQIFTMKEDPTLLAQKIREALDRGDRVILLSHSYYVTHVLPENPIRRLEGQLGKRVLALTLLGFGATADEIRQLEPKCLGSQMDTTGLTDLGCLVKLRSDFFARKAKKIKARPGEKAPYLGALEQTGERDFTLFTHVPL